MTAFADIPELRVPEWDEPALDLDRLEQIAEAAGHGHSHRGIGSRPSPWFDLEDNVRPSYDVHFVQTFNPRVVRYLLQRLKAAERDA